MTRSTEKTRGFTLLEILIVVAILGMLAALVIVNVGDARTEAEHTAFITSGKGFVDAAARYRLDTESFLEDSASGQMPAGFGAYTMGSQWTNVTPIGGVWDTELNESGITSALGVHFDGNGETRDDAYMTMLDARFDDGDLATGGFRKLAPERYYWVIAD